MTPAGSRLRAEGAPPVRTVFFDLGDTLMHIHPDVPTLYRTALADLGVEAPAAAVSAALVAGEHVYLEALRSGRTFECSMVEAHAFWEEYHGVVLGELGLDGGSPGLARALSERFWSPGSWRAFPEVHDVLGELRAAGLRLAVISNFTDGLPAVCRSHELDWYFDCLVSSTVIGSQKPDAGIFLEALRRTGADPAESVHVGDNYVADVLGARACGIDGVLVDRTRAGGRGMYDFTHRPRTAPGPAAGTARLDCPVVADLRELLALVRG